MPGAAGRGIVFFLIGLLEFPGFRIPLDGLKGVSLIFKDYDTLCNLQKMAPYYPLIGIVLNLRGFLRRTLDGSQS
jgi:hypothetical protein